MQEGRQPRQTPSRASRTTRSSHPTRKSITRSRRVTKRTTHLHSGICPLASSPLRSVWLETASIRPEVLHHLHDVRRQRVCRLASTSQVGSRNMATRDSRRAAGEICQHSCQPSRTRMGERTVSRLTPSLGLPLAPRTIARALDDRARVRFRAGERTDGGRFCELDASKKPTLAIRKRKSQGTYSGRRYRPCITNKGATCNSHT